MGKYDDISPEELRNDLIRFARLILQLEAEGGLLTSAAELQTLLGDLRRKLFAYEIRGTPEPPDSGEAAPEADEELDPVVKESLRVVREAMERQDEMVDDWTGPFSPDDDEEEDA